MPRRYLRLGTVVLLLAACNSSDAPAPGVPSAREQTLSKVLPFLGERPSSRPSPELKVISRQVSDSTIRLTVSYLVETEERITAYVYLPKGTGKVPGILAFHQTNKFGKDETAGLEGDPTMAYALELAEQGYAVITYDDVVTGERILDGASPYDTSAFYLKNPRWTVIDKAIWDGQQAITVLCLFPTVDCSRIGVVGHSQGGVYSWFLAGMDDRVKAAVVNCGFITFEGDPDPERWARDTWYKALPALKPYLIAKQFPFEWTEYLALISPRALLIMGSEADEVLPNPLSFGLANDALTPLYDEASSPGNLEISVFPGKHEFPSQRHSRMLSFFQEHL